MARPKSPSGSKRKDETQVNPSNLPPVAERTDATPTLKTNGARESTKLSLMKTDSRATIMPINLEDEIRRRAYELSEHRGFVSGHETDDWLTAESEVLTRYRQQSA